MKSSFSTLIMLLMFGTFSFAQIKMNTDFEAILKEAQISFNEPTENLYKTKKGYKNPIYNCNFAIKAKKSDLEIRYAFNQINPQESQNTFPHIISMNTANHIASNHENSEIVVQSITDEDLKKNFKADWACVFYFTPKTSFSNKRNCKMLALYKEGKGLVYTFFLFNKPSIELDHQFYSLSFKM